MSSDKSPMPCERLTILVGAVFMMVLAACQASPTIAPATGPDQLASSSVTASQDVSLSPSPIAGGCGATLAFAGPGPAAAIGLAENPWASATPPEAGITAYFWRHPPDLLVARTAGTSNSGATNKVLWINDGPGH